MGYESRLYVIHKFEGEGFVDYYSDGRCSAEVIATFELCKVPEFRYKIDKYPYTDCYIYADDRNTRILEDNYGEKLREIPLADAINILKECIEIDPWWRLKACLNMLEGLTHPGADTGLTVLHYGH